MNLIKHTNNEFYLLQNVPDKKDFMVSRTSSSGVYHQNLNEVKYNEAMKAREGSKLKIVNPEEIERKLYQNDKRITGPMSFDAWRRIILKPGDTFPLPEGILFKTEPGFNDKAEPIEGIRLYASKEEESQDQLTLDSYLKLLGVDRHHAIAVTIWDTLLHHNFTIQRKKP
jgi:hypothetical protein